jgi:NAD(P)-dependent dehydrogenase (short-subunit alcohol dehydrogenase family)
MRWDMRGDSAFITGAGSGIGRAVAIKLAEQGVRTAIADIERGRLEETALQVRNAGAQAVPIIMDVSSSEQVARGVAEAQAAFGRIEYLVNLAGIYQTAPVQEITDTDWARMLAIHVNGTFYTCRAVLPEMLKRRFGAIVNTSSLHALRGQELAAHYAAAKAGIMGFTKSLAREVGTHGLRVNAIAPGPIDTPLWRAGMTGSELESRIAQRALAVPMGRLGEPAEVADLVLFLLSDASAYITGQIFSINGGEQMV